MLSVLAVVLPIFALILVGWMARRGGALGPAAELNRFVVYLALPALLFSIIAKAQWAEIWQPGFIAAFGIAAAIVFALTIAVRVWRGRRVADAAIDGLNAGYANTAFMGFPLALGAFGNAALAPTLIASIITVCILFAAALVLIEVGLQTERHPGRMALRVARALASNPLVIAPTLGAAWLAGGLALPDAVDSFLKLLGGAASPCALVTLGLFLAEKRATDRSRIGDVGLLVSLKLIAQPALTWALAAWVLHLPPATTHIAVLLAALPTGTGPFMIAEFYKREAGLTSRVVLTSTVISLVTLAMYLSSL